MAIQTRDTIRQRMLKTASEFWGVQPSELASFDPVVNMMLGASAAEMEKMYNEIEISQSRVLERLSKLLVPEVYKGPVPAHGILHGTPSESKMVLTKITQFYYNKKIMLKESSVKESYRDVYFTPIDDFQLLNAEIKYIAYGDGIHEMKNAITRNGDKVVTAAGNKRIANNELWVGLHPDPELSDLNGISFYFDWLNVADRSLLLSYLAFTKWQTVSGNLEYLEGYVDHETRDEQLEEEFEFDVEKTIFRNTKSVYKNQFITIPTFDIKDAVKSREVPEAFRDVFGAKNLERVEKVVWVKIAFPSFVVHPEFDNLTVAVNCFPVVNRGMHEMYYRIQNNFNIVPLNLPENSFFFSIQSVKSAAGKEFTGLSLKDQNKLSTGLYVIRKGGIARFDSRSATEYLSNLVDLMRDESAAFQVYGQEVIAESIKSLHQILNQITQRMDRTGTGKSEVVNYIVLKPENFNDTIFVEFWATAGSFANSIRIGSLLNSYSGSDIKGETLLLVNNTSGGRDGLAGSELLDTFRQTLISRDRVVTETDIRYFCIKELNEKVSEVEVKKGLLLDSSAKSGFIKTIDIYLTPTDKLKYSAEEWNFICNDVKAKLGAKMSTFLPLRVSLKE